MARTSGGGCSLFTGRRRLLVILAAASGPIDLPLLHEKTQHEEWARGRGYIQIGAGCLSSDGQPRFILCICAPDTVP
jgi:hypothetical protein